MPSLGSQIQRFLGTGSHIETPSLAANLRNVLTNPNQDQRGNIMRPGILVALALTLATTTAGAAMYKWTDQNGRVQYGQFPPTGVESERISSAGTTHKVDPQDSKSPQQRLQELEARQKQQGEQDAEAAAKQQLAAQRQSNCDIARKNLAVLQEDGHHRVRLPDGTVTYLSDEQKHERIENANRQIKDNCD
jgi:hypothetical protein